MNDCEKVRRYTSAFHELENIMHAGFNFVVCNCRTRLEYPTIYLNAFYYFHDADAFCKIVSDRTDEIYQVFSIEELAYHIDCKTCECLEGEEVD